MDAFVELDSDHNKANIDHQDAFGKTVLHYAVNGTTKGNWNLNISKNKMKNIFYKRNFENKLNWNQGHFAIVEYLVDQGADTGIKDKYGKTALQYANGKWKYWYSKK